MRQIHQKFRVRSLPHYWKLKTTQEILKKEIVERADKLLGAEKGWKRASLYKFTERQRRERASEVRELGLNLARLQGRLKILNDSLSDFEYHSNYVIPVERV